MPTLKTVGVLIYSTLVTLAFSGTCFALYYSEIPPSQEKYALIVLGALIAEFRSVGSYWTGSTMSSQKKDDTIAEIARQ